MKIQLAASAAIAAALSACSEPPMAVSQTENPNFQVSVLFHHDGCRVNRFNDAGRYVYFVTCPATGKANAAWQTRHSCGKSCVRTEDHRVETAEVPQW